jgi:hypothetical protein
MITAFTACPRTCRRTYPTAASKRTPCRCGLAPRGAPFSQRPDTHRHVERSRVERQGQTRDAGDVAEDPRRLEPVVARSPEEQREGEHEPERAGLAVPGDIDARGAEHGEQHRCPTDEHLANQHDDREPTGRTVDDEDAADTDEEEEAVGHRVEHLAEVLDLV